MVHIVKHAVDANARAGRQEHDRGRIDMNLVDRSAHQIRATRGRQPAPIYPHHLRLNQALAMQFFRERHEIGARKLVYKISRSFIESRLDLGRGELAETGRIARPTGAIEVDQDATSESLRALAPDAHHDLLRKLQLLKLAEPSSMLRRTAS